MAYLAKNRAIANKQTEGLEATAFYYTKILDIIIFLTIH